MSLYVLFTSDDWYKDIARLTISMHKMSGSVKTYGTTENWGGDAVL